MCQRNITRRATHFIAEQRLGLLCGCQAAWRVSDRCPSFATVLSGVCRVWSEWAEDKREGLTVWNFKFVWTSILFPNILNAQKTTGTFIISPGEHFVISSEHWLNSIVSRYGDWAKGCRMQGQNPHTGQNFSLLQNIHTGFIIHPNPYSLGTGVLFLGLNRSGRELYHPRPSYTWPPLFVFW